MTEVGLGTWNIGGDWGDVSDEEGREAIRTALDAGVDFLDITGTPHVPVSRRT